MAAMLAADAASLNRRLEALTASFALIAAPDKRCSRSSMLTSEPPAPRSATACSHPDRQWPGKQDTADAPMPHYDGSALTEGLGTASLGGD
jgi:hypothetical protein